MVINQLQSTIGYRCPVCGTGILSMVGVFALSGDMIKLKCDCGKSELMISYTRDKKIRLSVPCLFCPNPHTFVLSNGKFFEKELFCIPCALAGLDICFIGDKDHVLAAMTRTEEKIMGMLREAGMDTLETLRTLSDDDCSCCEHERHGGETNFSDNHMNDLVSFVVRELFEEGAVRCRCADGIGRYEMINENGDVVVRCKRCGAQRRIPCSQTLAANALVEADVLILE